MGLHDFAEQPRNQSGADSSLTCMTYWQAFLFVGIMS